MTNPLRLTWMTPCLSLLLFTVGCSRDEVQTYRLPKENTPAAPSTGMPQGMGMGMGTGEVPPPPAGGGLKWTLPKGWSEEKGGGMRFATLKAPSAGKLDISVVVLAGSAGGELANVNRWRGQIGLAPTDEKTLAATRQTVKAKAGAIAVFDFSSDGQVKTRMVTGQLSTADGNTWFLKMVGEAGPVAQAKPEFLRLMESLRLDSAN